MDWPVIREAIRVAVASATGLELGNGLTTGAVFWQNTARSGGWKPKVTAEIRLKTWTGVGEDEERADYDPDTGTRTVAICGNRRMVISVRIESDTQANSNAVTTYSSLLRTRLQRQSILQGLRDAHIALSTVLPTVEMDYLAEQRMVSVGITDIVLLGRELDIDTTEGSADWIESVTIDSEHLVKEDGTNRDVSIDVGPVPD